MDVGLFLDPCRFWFISAVFPSKSKFKTISKIEPQSGVEILEFDKTYIIVIEIHKFYGCVVRKCKLQVFTEM